MEKVLNFIARITKEYGYKPLPSMKSQLARNFYTKNIPSFLNINGDPSAKLYSTSGTLICEGYNRIVVGDYGAFIEFDRAQAFKDNYKCQPGQEYRFKDPSFARKVKYFWYTTKDNSACKLYFQQKGVAYADYKAFQLYISPYEVKFNA